MKTKEHNIEFIKGNSYSLQVILKTNIENIQNIYFRLTDGKEKILFSKKLNEGITFENNIITLRLKPNDTNDLTSNENYFYDIQLDYGTNDVYTPIMGDFKVKWNSKREETEV